MLQYRRPQHPLGNGAVEGEDDSDDEENQKEQEGEGEMDPDTHSGIGEHIFEHLPPKLHKGNKECIR